MSEEHDNLSPSGSRRMSGRSHVRRDRRWFKAVALLLVAVGAGVVIGVGGTLMYVRNSMYRLPPRPDAIADAMMRRIVELTQATPDEETQLKQVLARHMDEVEELRVQFFADTRRKFEGMNSEVDAIFGPERGRMWRDYVKKRAEEHPRRGNRHGGRMGPPSPPPPYGDSHRR